VPGIKISWGIPGKFTRLGVKKASNLGFWGKSGVKKTGAPRVPLFGNKIPLGTPGRKIRGSKNNHYLGNP